MKAAFIPKNLVIDGKWIKYADVRGIWGDGTIGIDFYYNRNFAKFKRLAEEEIAKIDKIKEVDADGVVNLYESVFNMQILITVDKKLLFVTENELFDYTFSEHEILGVLK